MSNIAPLPFDLPELAKLTFTLKKILDLSIYNVDYVANDMTRSTVFADYIVISLKLGQGPIGIITQPIIRLYLTDVNSYNLTPLEGCPPINWFQIRSLLAPNYQDPEENSDFFADGIGHL